MLRVVIKGVWNAVASTKDESSTATVTHDSMLSAAKSSSQLIANREKTCESINCSLGNVSIHVLIDFYDDYRRMLRVLDANYVCNRLMSRIAVQIKMSLLSYNRQIMSEYVDPFASFFSKLYGMGNYPPTSESHKDPIRLSSTEPNYSLVLPVAAFETKEV